VKSRLIPRWIAAGGDWPGTRGGRRARLVSAYSGIRDEITVPCRTTVIGRPVWWSARYGCCRFFILRNCRASSGPLTCEGFPAVSRGRGSTLLPFRWALFWACHLLPPEAQFALSIPEVRGGKLRRFMPSPPRSSLASLKSFFAYGSHLVSII